MLDYSLQPVVLALHELLYIIICIKVKAEPFFLTESRIQEPKYLHQHMVHTHALTHIANISHWKMNLQALNEKDGKSENFSGSKIFQGYVYSNTKRLLSQLFDSNFVIFFPLYLSLTRRENNGIINYLYYKNKIRWARTRREKKIMIDNLELSLLLVMKRNFYWWYGDGELVRERAINDMHTNFFSCCSVLSDDKMLCNVQCSYVIRQLLFCSYPRHADTHYCVSLWKISWGSHWNQFAFDVESSGKVFLAEKKFRHYH